MDQGFGVPPPPNDMRHLFPVSINSSWTTATAAGEYDAQSTTRHITLSDSELGVHRISSGTTHKLYTLVDGARAWEAVYQEGSYKPSGGIKGGFGFYLKGPGDEWIDDMSKSVEVIFAYAVRFQEGFDFVKGGKLPGVFGGDGAKAFGCTGGRQKDHCSCFNLRLMWRANGQGELYAYLPLTESNKHRLLAVPGSRQNHEYGFSVGRGSFNFRRGIWATISERVKLNDLGKENGEIQVWVDGISVISVTGVVLRCKKEAVIQGLHFETFFGGSTSEWASSKEQRAWFANISGGMMRRAKPENIPHVDNAGNKPFCSDVRMFLPEPYC